MHPSILLQNREIAQTNPVAFATSVAYATHLSDRFEDDSNGHDYGGLSRLWSACPCRGNAITAAVRGDSRPGVALSGAVERGLARFAAFPAAVGADGVLVGSGAARIGSCVLAFNHRPQIQHQPPIHCPKTVPLSETILGATTAKRIAPKRIFTTVSNIANESSGLGPVR